RPPAEKLEVRTIDNLGVHELRLAGAVEDEAAAEPRRHAVKRSGLPAPVEVVGERRPSRLQIIALHFAPQLDETLGVRIRQRPQQRRIPQPEDRGRGTYAEGE